MGTVEEEAAATLAYTAAYDAYAEVLHEQAQRLNDVATARAHLPAFLAGQARLHSLQDAMNRASDDYERVLSTHTGEPAPSRAEWAADRP